MGKREPHAIQRDGPEAVAHKGHDDMNGGQSCEVPGWCASRQE
jgi:hypothetical protein